MKTICRFRVLGITLGLLAPVLASQNVFAADATAPAAAAPASKGVKLTGEGLVISKQLTALFDKSKDVNAKGAKQAQARGAIETALDWDRVAKDCLPESEYKKQQGSKNLTEFRSLLKEVIVKTAYTRLDTFWKNASYYFSKMDVTGDKAHVQAIFEVKDKEGNESFSLDYYLSKKAGKWVIYDVAFEEVRYSENIREQIKTFLGEKGFPSLLGKLRERKGELVQGQQG